MDYSKANVRVKGEKGGPRVRISTESRVGRKDSETSGRVSGGGGGGVGGGGGGVGGGGVVGGVWGGWWWGGGGSCGKKHTKCDTKRQGVGGRKGQSEVKVGVFPRQLDWCAMLLRAKCMEWGL